jgi:ubiquinone/menaquinone biosynthesis C-methylase UbiE
VDGDRIECQDCYEVYFVRDGIPYFVKVEELSEFEREESRFHSTVAEQADKAHGQTTLRAEYLHNGFLAPILELPSESLLLDVACGSGVDVVRLAQQGYRVIGVDISPGMILTTRHKIRELGLSGRVFLCVANARQLPFREARFQAAYICAALHHMRDPGFVLSEVARVTEEDGVVSIGSEPNAWIYRFRTLKHSRFGCRLLRLFRDDYTVGEQSPGDRETPGWSFSDWPRIIQGTGLELVKVDPVWYLNGAASLLGLHSLPHWLEAGMCRVDGTLTRVPLIRHHSVKWNVLTRKKGSMV